MWDEAGLCNIPDGSKCKFCIKIEAKVRRLQRENKHLARCKMEGAEIIPERVDPEVQQL